MNTLFVMHTILKKEYTCIITRKKYELVEKKGQKIDEYYSFVSLKPKTKKNKKTKTKLKTVFSKSTTPK